MACDGEVFGGGEQVRETGLTTLQCKIEQYSELNGYWQ